ncbi:MAG TPA: hypothetical protein VGC56_04250 [Allosphingosinicella sp.]
MASLREDMRRQGHDLSPLQQGIIERVAAWDPAYEPAAGKDLELIESAIEADGRWAVQEEWRISTCFDSSITRSTRNCKEVYEVCVECDGQRLACACPTLEGAYAFMRLYQAFIVDQFYSLGPPWAATDLFK